MRRALAFLAISLQIAFAAAPVVSKVEPPDWAVEPEATTLRMLITGTNLAGATVRSTLHTGSATISQSGTHLFVDLSVPAHTAPGTYPLEISTADGVAKAPFAIVPALNAAGRFQGFSSDDVLYLIMPDRFANGDPSNDEPSSAPGLHDRAKSRYYHGGDLDGIIQHLPYLKDLGVTALWLTPVVANTNRLNSREKYENQAITDYHGYGAVDFYSVDPHFGDVRKFTELVDKAHALGIKIVQDQVANHTGPYHPWVQDPPTPTWFNGTETQHLANTWRTWTLIDPHATPETQKSTLEGWFANILPDLNQNDPEVARYLIQNSLWWIERTGIDGIREDTLPYVPRHFWRDWTQAIKHRYPSFRIVGEVFDADPSLVSFFQGGRERNGIDTGIDSVFDFPLHYALHRVFTRAGKLPEIPQTLAHDFQYTDPNRLVTFVDLHDVARFMNEPGATVDGLKGVFTLLMTARGIPMVYYGDEVGMQGGNDPDNRRDFPGGWKEDKRNAFEPQGRTPEEQGLRDHLRRLAKIRSENSPLRHGAMVDLLTEDNAYAFARTTPEGSILVVFNNAAEPAALQVPLAKSGINADCTLEDLLGSAAPARAHNGIAEVPLAGRSAAIYQPRTRP